MAGLADLRGRTLEVTTIGSGSWGFANIAAQRARLDPTRDEFVRASGDTLRRFLTALNESTAWVHSASVEEITRTIAPVTEEAPSAALSEAVRRSIPGVPRTALVSEATFAVAVRALRESGAIKDALPFGRAVDNTFAGSQ